MIRYSSLPPPPKTLEDIRIERNGDLIEVDKQRLRRWAMIMMTPAECADRLGVTTEEFETALQREPLKTIWRQGRGEFAEAIREQQFVIAHDNDAKAARAGMVRFLGVQHLGQVDSPNMSRDPDDVQQNGFVLNVSLAPPPPRALDQDQNEINRLLADEDETDNIIEHEAHDPLSTPVDVPPPTTSNIRRR